MPRASIHVLGVVLLLVAALYRAPVKVQAGASQSAGETLFHEKGCEQCHGVHGEGGDRGPNLSGVGRRRNREGIVRQIHDGGGNMPPFGNVLDPSEINQLADYLSKRKAKTKAGENTGWQPPTASPASQQPSPAPPPE